MNPHHFTWADALLHGKEALQKQEQLADVFSSFSPSAMSCVYIPCCHQEVGKSVCFVVFTCLAPPACLVAQAGNSPAVPQLYDVRKGGYRRSCVTACSFFSFLICQRRAVGTVGFYCLFFFFVVFFTVQYWERVIPCGRGRGELASYGVESYMSSDNWCRISFLVAFHGRPIGWAIRNRTIYLRARRIATQIQYSNL